MYLLSATFMLWSWQKLDSRLDLPCSHVAHAVMQLWIPLNRYHKWDTPNLNFVSDLDTG